MKKNNEQTLKEALNHMVNAYKLRSKLSETQIRETWKGQMGPTIVSLTRSIDIHGDKVTITVDSSPLKSELMYGREKIKDMFNQSLGEEFVKEVIIR